MPIYVERVAGVRRAQSRRMAFTLSSERMVRPSGASMRTARSVVIDVPSKFELNVLSRALSGRELARARRECSHELVLGGLEQRVPEVEDQHDA